MVPDLLNQARAFVTHAREIIEAGDDPDEILEELIGAVDWIETLIAEVERAG